MVERETAERAVRTLLEYLEGEEGREGTERTPERVIDAWDEIFSGYKGDASSILEATFNGEGYDGIVLLSNIEFHSTCEHPFATLFRSCPCGLHPVSYTHLTLPTIYSV